MILQIVTNKEEVIEGTKAIFLNQDFIKNIQEISDNESEEILLGDVLNKLTKIDDVKQLFSIAASKLRKGGIMKISFLNPRLIASSLLRGEITEETFNNIIYSKSCLFSLSSLEEWVKALNLKIDQCSISGAMYDVTISR